MAHPKAVIARVFGYGDVQQYSIAAATLQELHSELRRRVDSSGAFDIVTGDSKTPLTEATFPLFLESPWPAIHVSSTAKAAPAPALISDLRFEPEPNERRPSIRWQVPRDGGGLDKVGHFLVVIVVEGPLLREAEKTRFTVDPPGGGREDLCAVITQELTDDTHRVEVSAIGKDGKSLETQIIRFVAEKAIPPGRGGDWHIWREYAEKLEPALKQFQSERFHRDPLILVVGKQHHGKSSLINHLNRWLRGEMDQTDVVRAAPAGELETTLRTKEVPVPFLKKWNARLLDMPALAVMSDSNVEYLRNLLWHAASGIGRGDRRRVLPNPPDGVIVAVSLLSWRDERSQLRTYLKKLQEELNEESQEVPYVVAATHRDTFLSEERNKGNDPKRELERALQDLREMSNTSQVFAIANYGRESWRAPEVDSSTVEMLRQLTTAAAKHVPRTMAVWYEKVRWAAGNYGYRAGGCVVAAIAFGVMRVL